MIVLTPSSGSGSGCRSASRRDPVQRRADADLLKCDFAEALTLGPKGITFADVTSMVSAAESTYCPD